MIVWSWRFSGSARAVTSISRFRPTGRPGLPPHLDDFGRGQSHYDRYYGDPTNTANPNLRPLRRGPFYAVQVVPGDLGTCGGVDADEHARVLGEDGAPIEGLYASGNVSAIYPGPGATIGQGMVFSWLAARHVTERVEQRKKAQVSAT